jgi:hypothetical protein
MQTFSLMLACLILPMAVIAADPSSTNYDNSVSNSVSGVQSQPLTSDAYDSVMDARTIGAGHIQLEGALINYFFNSPTPRFHPSSEYAWDPRITVGLWTNVDLFVHPSYEIRNYKYRSGSSEFGRINTGFKANLWGNESGTTAFAVKPYLSIPTEGGNVLGGVDLALLVRLTHGFYIKFDTEFYATENDNDTLYAGFANSMSINKVLCSKTEAYCYLDSDVTTDPAQQWGGYAGFGLKYNFTNKMQIFAGMGFGLNSSSSYDYNPRLGFVWRF